MIIKKLVWDEWNTDHIARAGGYFYPMTARDADDKEKRRFKNEKN